MLVLGCEDLIVATDHLPLLGIFNDQDLGTIVNPRIQDLKGKTLRFRLTIQHCPDAMSRYPAAAAVENNPEIPSPGTTSKAVDVLDVIRRRGTPVEEKASDEEESIAYAISIDALKHLSALNDNSLITIDQVNDICRSDGVYQKLAKAISGFPKTRSITDPEIWEYWEVHNGLSLFRDTVLLDDRIVMP